MNGISLIPIFMIGLLGSVHRIGMYMTAGAIAGAIGGGLFDGVRTMSDIASFQLAGYWLANLMLIALGLYLMDAWRGLTALEAAGHVLWRRIQPWMKNFLPVDSAWKAFAIGGLWGWVPCGMVYSVLLTAMLSGSASSGAGVMLAFGLGTLPMLLGIGLLGMRMLAWLRRRDVRIACGMLVLAFSLLGLLRAAGGMPHGWNDAFCLSPPVYEGQR